MNLAKAFLFMLRVGHASDKERREPYRKIKGWYHQRVFDEVHCLPAADLDAHLAVGTECHCSPIRDAEVRNLIIHYAFDGRELVERTELGLPLL